MAKRTAKGAMYGKFIEVYICLEPPISLEGTCQGWLVEPGDQRFLMILLEDEELALIPSNEIVSVHSWPDTEPESEVIQLNKNPESFDTSRLILLKKPSSEEPS